MKHNKAQAHVATDETEIVAAGCRSKRTSTHLEAPPENLRFYHSGPGLFARINLYYINLQRAMSRS